MFSFHFFFALWVCLYHCSVPVCSVWVNVDSYFHSSGVFHFILLLLFLFKKIFLSHDIL